MTTNWRTFLVTGPEEALMAWQGEAMFVVELFDRREQTVRCRAFGPDRGQVAYDKAVQLARRFDVTLQDLVVLPGRTENPVTHDLGGGVSVTVADNVEKYPVVHLASHGMTWPEYRRRGAEPCA